MRLYGNTKTKDLESKRKAEEYEKERNENYPNKRRRGGEEAEGGGQNRRKK